MKVVRATANHVVHVVETMREISAAEAFASRPNDDRAALAMDLIEIMGHMVVLNALLADDETPVALIGLGWAAPGRATMLFLANDGLPSINVPLHRWWRRHFVPEWMARFRRVEFTGSLPDTPSGHWLQWCGFACEGVARSYSKAGADFGHWGWVNPQWIATVDAAAEPVSSQSA